MMDLDREYRPDAEPGRAQEPLVQRRTGIVKDPRYAGHCMGPEAPECPERLQVLYAMLDELEWRDAFQEIVPRPAEEEELAQVHSPQYIGRLAATAGREFTYLDEDTCTSPFSHEAALLAAGGLCRAIEAVVTGQVDNAFAMVRPPGHHAERDASGGFCLYNNVAVGAHYAQKTLGAARVLVVDWDLHHGNGTQHCFESDPSVLFFSTHRAFTYPHTGRLNDIGKGGAKGYTVNIPLLPGFGDSDYLALFEHLLKPIALEFNPDLILVSAGFDIHVNDPLGGMRVTPAGFAGMTRILMDIAAQCYQGRVVMSLEGGYDLEGLRHSVREVLMEMTGRRTTDIRERLATADPRKTGYVIWRVRQVHQRYWKSLKTASGGGTPGTPSLKERLQGSWSRWMAYLNS